MKKKTRDKKSKAQDKNQPEAVAAGTADLSKFIDDMVATEAMSSEKLETKDSVKSFVDSMMSVAEEKKEGNRQKSREKSKGATGGISKSLDTAIKNLMTAERVDRGEISKNKRAIEENYQAIRRQSVSISTITQQLEKVSHQAERAISMFNDMDRRLNALQEYIDKKLKQLEQPEKESSFGDLLSDMLGSGFKKAGKAVGRGVTTLARNIPKFLRVGAGPAALGAAGIALYNMRQETLESDLGAAYEKGDLNKIKNQAIRQGQTGMLANDAELQQLVEGGPDLAKDILATGGRDVERYGKQNLEKIAAGEKPTIEEMKKNVGEVGVTVVKKEIEKAKQLGPAKGPQESAAVKAARAETGGSGTPETTTPSTTTRKDGQKTDGPGAGGLGGGGGDTIGGGQGFVPADYKQDREFTDELNKLASKYNIDANDLLAVMYSESGLDPHAVNKGSGASGLIQFIPSTAKGLGTSVEDIRKMNRAQQMKYVEAYFASVNLPKNATGGQIYASVFLPAFINKPVLASRGDQYYNANAGLDLDGDGKITMKDLDARVAQMRSRHGLGAGSAKSGVTPGATDEMGRSLPGSTPDAVPTEKGVQPAGTNFSAPNPSAGTGGQGRDVSSGYKPSPGEASGLNFASGVDKNINEGVAKKVSEIQSMVGGVTISSGFRDPQRNAASGGAKNSAHMRGNAVDLTFSGGERETLRVIQAASKAGIGGIGVYKPGHIHVDTESRRVWGPDYTPNSISQVPWAADILNAHMGGKMGQYDPSARGTGSTQREGVGGGRYEGTGSVPQGRMNQQNVDPMQMVMRGLGSTIGGGRGSTIPTTIGAAATMPGVGPMMGLLSTLAMGGARTMVPQSPSGIMGLVGSLFNTLNNQNRGNNPQFNIDSLKDNSVPSALPPAEILRDIFGMDVPTTYAP